MHYRTRALTTIAVLTLYSHAWADNAVTRWVEQALDTVRTQNMGTAPAARVYAMTTVAMYDAVNGIDRSRHLSTREHAIVPSNSAPSLGDRRAAAAAAAHAVLKSFVAVGSAQATSLDAALAAELQNLKREPIQFVAAGQAWGAEVGQAVVTARSTDGTQVAETQPAGTGIGEYRTPFSGAQFRLMAPFGVDSIEKYVARTPPELTSDEYAASFNEVKVHGDVNDPDPTRAAIARHWQAEANTGARPGCG